jgi:hypothetical protein
MKSMSEFVQGLRDAADFFEAHLALGLPNEYDVAFHYYSQVAGVSVDTIGGLNLFASIVGGHIKKDADESYYRLTADRGSFKVIAIAMRNNVCERVVVGTKIEPAHVIPAQPETEVPERVVEIYEYHCPTLTKPLPKPAIDGEPSASELETPSTPQLEAENVAF